MQKNLGAEKSLRQPEPFWLGWRLQVNENARHCRRRLMNRSAAAARRRIGDDTHLPPPLSESLMFLHSSPSATRRSLNTLALSLALVLGGLATGAAQAGDIMNANMDAYQQAAAQKKPILMHVHASWCPVCAKQSPIIEELMKEPEFKDVVVFKIDFDAD